MKHLDLVASLGCVVCLRRFGLETPAEIHHLRTCLDGTPRGMANRAPDTEVIPLCPCHHRHGDATQKYSYHVGYHFNPALFEATYGTELELYQYTQELLGLTDNAPKNIENLLTRNHA